MIPSRTATYLTISHTRPSAGRASSLSNVGALPTNSQQSVLRKPLHTATMLNGYLTI